MTQKIYGGIYSQQPNQATDLFLGDAQQIQMDQFIAPFYLWETIVHNLMLAKSGLVPWVAAKKILKALSQLMEHTNDEGLKLDPNIGDLHENVESWLYKEIGPESGWFHLARSRNDQIACDQKLATKSLFYILGEQLALLGKVLGSKSKQYSRTIMPGYTHLRSAMPSSFGFWWQAYFVQIIEVQNILKSVYSIVDTNPLGAGASYGVNWPIDTNYTTKSLAFSKSLTNALAAINNRGLHELHWLGALVSLTTILSRMMEDVIIWSSPETNLIQISQHYTSGSSIMPQKINPDVAEKIRAKAGILLGYYTQLTMTLKGTASGYNRDSAETKIATINALNESINVVKMATQMLASILPNETNMLAATKLTLATKVADQLAQKYNIPFRSAHQILGICLKQSQYSLDLIETKLIEQSTYQITGRKIHISSSWLKEIIDVNNSLSLYSYVGTPNSENLDMVTKDLLSQNHAFYDWVNTQAKKFALTKKLLINDVKQYLKETHES